MDQSGGKTPIVGKPQATVGQAQIWAEKRGATQKFIDLALIYWAFGTVTGIRPEVLYAQSAKETAFGRFGGVVTEDMNNFAGIKTRDARGDKREDLETFSTIRDGVRAHFNHICAYVGIDPVGQPHPRYYLVKSISWAGTIKAVEELGGKYAPYPDYGESIVTEYLNPMMETKDPGTNQDNNTNETKITTTVNSYIAVRSGPDSSSSVIGKIKPNETVEIVSILYKIKYGEGYGYINPNDTKLVMHKVCIDAAHGEKDTGAIGTRGTQEKVLALDIAKRVEKRLSKYPIEVIMTRKNDTFIGLSERANQANDEQCDAFVSVHLNSASNSSANGIETFHYATNGEGGKLASSIQNRLIQVTGAIDRGVKTANFTVIKNTTMASVLVEGGFISNVDEEAKLLNENYRDKIASAITDGILEYLGIGITQSSDVENPKPEPDDKTTIGIVKVNSYLNVRSGPSSSYSIIGKLKPDTVVEIISTHGGWYKIKYGNAYGYVYAKYVKVN